MSSVSGHMLQVEDTTRYSCVIVCECGESFVGVGPERREEAISGHRSHAVEAQDYRRHHEVSRAPHNNTPSTATDDEIVAALVSGEHMNAVRKRFKIGSPRVSRVFGTLTPEQRAMRVAVQDDQRPLEAPKAPKAPKPERKSKAPRATKAARSTAAHAAHARALRAEQLGHTPETDKQIAAALREGIGIKRIAAMFRVGRPRVRAIRDQLNDQAAA